MRFLFIGVAIVLIVFVVTAVAFQIFRSSTEIFSTPASSRNLSGSTVATTSVGQILSTTSANNNPAAQYNFHGPSSTPHIIGPSGPPPNY